MNLVGITGHKTFQYVVVGFLDLAILVRIVVANSLRTSIIRKHIRNTFKLTLYDLKKVVEGWSSGDPRSTLSKKAGTCWA